MSPNCTAFAGRRRIASGPLSRVATEAQDALRQDPGTPILIFSNDTARVIDLDLRGNAGDLAARLAQDNAPRVAEPARGPGRPKLGVVAREVTLLPRHWQWLQRQRGGASAALRRLVEEASRSGDSEQKIRAAREATYRFMSAMAGDEPGFEEASRALFAGDRARFEAEIAGWPLDLRDFALDLSAPSFVAEEG